MEKFGSDVNVELIVEHIMNNTSIIDPKEFIVEKLTNNGENYASFKISTYTIDLVKEIKRIWAPRFTARNYDSVNKKQKSNDVTKHKIDHGNMNTVETNRNTNYQNNWHVRSERNRNVYASYRRHTPNNEFSRNDNEYGSRKAYRENVRNDLDIPKRNRFNDGFKRNRLKH